MKTGDKVGIGNGHLRGREGKIVAETLVSFAVAVYDKGGVVEGVGIFDPEDIYLIEEDQHHEG